MCLAVPGVVQSIEGTVGMVDYGGLVRRVDLTLTPQVQLGDRVIVHAGFAIAVLSQEEGDELIQLVDEIKDYA